MIHVFHRSRLGAFSAMLFGVAILALVVTGGVGGILREGFQLTPLILMLPLFGIGLAGIVFGLDLWVYVRKVALHYNFVEFSERSIFKKKAWREPLFNYTGVSRRSHHLTGGKNTSTKTRYEIFLKHPDPKKEARLFSSLSDRYFEESWNGFSRLLNVPLLEETEDRIASNGSPAISKEKDFKEEAGKNDPNNLSFSDRIWIEKAGFGFRVCHKRLWSSWSTSLGVIFTGVLYLVAPNIVPEAGRNIPNAVLMGFFILFLVVFLLQVFSIEEVWVSHHEVKYQIRYPWGRKVRMTLLAADITEVKVKTDPHRLHLPDIVSIVGKEGIIHFARYSTAEDKAQIRDFILSTIHQRSQETELTA